MLNKEKIGLVADYLGLRFPMCTIEILNDMPCGPGYRIDRGGRTDQFFISREFLNDCAKEILLPALEQLDLYDLFSLARGRNVLLGSGGIVFQEDHAPQKHESADREERTGRKRQDQDDTKGKRGIDLFNAA